MLDDWLNFKVCFLYFIAKDRTKTCSSLLGSWRCFATRIIKIIEFIELPSDRVGAIVVKSVNS